MTGHPAVDISVQSLLDERHYLPKVANSRVAGSGPWPGYFRGRRRGQGSEFDDLRHYHAGDDTRHIDWKASARTNIMHTRLYREERDHRVTLVTDLRDIMFTGSAELLSVQACRLSARLAWQATEGGSRVQLIIVGNQGISVSEPGSGHRAAIDACGLLVRCFQRMQTGIHSTPTGNGKTNAEPSSTPNFTDSDLHNDIDDILITPGSDSDDHYNAGTTLAQVAQWLSQQAGKPTNVLWISAFDRCGNHFERDITQLSAHAMQAAILIQDPLIRTGLPTGQYHYHPVEASIGRAGSHFPGSPPPGRSTLGRTSVKRLRSCLQNAVALQEQQFTELSIPLFNANEYGPQLLAALRHGGFLP